MMLTAMAFTTIVISALVIPIPAIRIQTSSRMLVTNAQLIQPMTQTTMASVLLPTVVRMTH